MDRWVSEMTAGTAAAGTKVPVLIGHTHPLSVSLLHSEVQLPHVHSKGGTQWLRSWGLRLAAGSGLGPGSCALMAEVLGAALGSRQWLGSWGLCPDGSGPGGCAWQRAVAEILGAVPGSGQWIRSWGGWLRSWGPCPA